MERQSIDVLAQNLAQAYMLSRTLPVARDGEDRIQRGLQRSIQHPAILSAEILNDQHEIVAQAIKPRVTPDERAELYTRPIENARGEPQGLITMALHEKYASGSRALQIKVAWTAGLGFLLGFLLTIGVLIKKNEAVPQFIAAIKKVSQGDLEVELPATDDPAYKELITSFHQMLEGLKERDRMRHSLGRIMDPKIAEILIKENPRLGGLKRQATILFCDIRNYTSICEELSPDELQEFLNDYWRGTVEIIMEQDGTIDKFHGDGVCVVFGAPNLHEDDPLRAIRTAWRLVRNVEVMNQVREKERKVPIQIGIGIHSGEVIAGNIGSERRMDYTVVGDVVNVAARIEELNKKFGTKILISDKVYEKVEEFVRVKTLTLAYLRGHKRPILVHTVREFNDAALPVPQQKAA